MQPFGIAPPLHHPTGEFINDDHLVVLDDVIDIFGKQLMGAQGLVHMVDDGDVLYIIQAPFPQQVGLFPQQRFNMLRPFIGQGHGALFFIFFVIILGQMRNKRIDRHIHGR